MNKILEMREKRSNLWNAAKSFLNTHQDANGLMSAEDNATYEKMEADVVSMGKAIDRLEREEAIDIEMDKPTAKPIVDKVNEEDAKKGTASKAYNTAFWTGLKDKVMSREVYDTLKVGSDANGGYLVPDEFEKMLVDKLADENIFRKVAHIIRTASGDHQIPVVASHGTAAWTDEEALYNESDDTFTQKSLGAYKLTTMLKISEELMNDSAFDMASYVSGEFARRIGAAEETAFITGDGSKKPTGILDSTNGATAIVTTAAVSAITFDEIMDLYFGVRAPYRKHACFVMNDATVKMLRKIKTTNGDYIWQPAVTAGTPDTLLNCPVYTSAAMPVATTGNDAVLFGDFSYYWIADRTSRSFKRLNELYAANGQVGFLASERVDGKLILNEAVGKLTMK